MSIEKKEASENRPPELLLAKIRLDGLARPVVDPQRSECGGAGILGRAAENVLPPGNLEILETGPDDHLPQLCLQQSPGDSAGPEIDFELRFFGNGFLH